MAIGRLGEHHPILSTTALVRKILSCWATAGRTAAARTFAGLFANGAIAQMRASNGWMALSCPWIRHG
jgi:hypothetical protein